MAFIGKKTPKKKAKAPFVVTANGGRLGIVIRGGIVAAGADIEILVGTDEDFGKIMIQPTECGTPCKKFGKTGKTVSWSAVRAAYKILPEMKRHEAFKAVQTDDGSIIVDLDLTKGA